MNVIVKTAHDIGGWRSTCTTKFNALPKARQSAILWSITLAVVVIVSIGSRFGLGARTPLYLVQLVTVGYLPWTTVGLVLVWIAVASQLASLTSGRYGPYADGVSHPPPGAIREAVRRSVRAAQLRRR